MVTKKVDLVSLKNKGDNLDIDKFEIVAVDLSKQSNVVEKMLPKKDYV